jgi:hypothetical protein
MQKEKYTYIGIEVIAECKEPHKQAKLLENHYEGDKILTHDTWRGAIQLANKLNKL